jgi:DNA-binding HxlR family transcriptional regulator
MKKANLADADCPVARALEIVGDWWSLLIVRDALTGMRRFGQFAAHLGLAKNILADRLKKLVAHGIFEVVPASDGSAYSEYAITQKGIDLFWVLVALRQWSDKWIEGADQCEEILVDAENGRPVKPLQLHAADGRQLSMFDVRLVQRETASL